MTARSAPIRCVSSERHQFGEVLKYTPAGKVMVPDRAVNAQKRDLGADTGFGISVGMAANICSAILSRQKQADRQPEAPTVSDCDSATEPGAQNGGDILPPITQQMGSGFFFTFRWPTKRVARARKVNAEVAPAFEVNLDERGKASPRQPLHF